MKKNFSLLISVISSLFVVNSLSGCNGINNNGGASKTHLEQGFYFYNPIEKITEFDELTYDALATKIINEDSFLLAIYNDTCTCWTDFAPVLVEYMNRTHVKVEYINVDRFIDRDNYGLYLEKSGLPALAVFSNGKLSIEATYLKNRDLFKDSKKLEAFINENVYLPKQFFIDKETLDFYISSNKEFNLYVSRTGCPDCLAADTDVLKLWNRRVDRVSEPLYIFDLKDYYASSYSGSSEEEIKAYQDIKDLYGLSEKNNPTLGYSTGMVPTFQRRKGNEIKDMIVVLNDSQNEGIVSSYFTSERIQNMPFLKDSSLDLNMDGLKLEKEDEEQDYKSYWRIYKSDYYKKYHYPILNLFLDTYVK